MLKHILKLNTETLLDYIVMQLEGAGYEGIIHCEDYIYAVGTDPVLLNAHIDTVHYHEPKELYHDEKQGVMWSPTGIGGDDRCGIYTILKLVRDFKPTILITNYEEVGCKGAYYFLTDYFYVIPPVNFVIGLDRRGSNDAVFYDSGNGKFIKFILDHGWTKNDGSFSDISVLCPEWDIAGVNLSVGYYNAHKGTEYIKVRELEANIKRVATLIKKSSAQPLYEFEDTWGMGNAVSNNWKWASKDAWEYEIDPKTGDYVVDPNTNYYKRVKRGTNQRLYENEYDERDSKWYTKGGNKSW